MKLILKIKGIQMSAIKIFHPVNGMRQVVYAKEEIELTVDTNKGSYIITENDLKSYLTFRS